MTTTLDPARVARALSLDVRPLDDGDGYEVSGGAGSHTVELTEHGWACGCPDSRFHDVVCKHRAAVYFHRQLDHRVREALRVVVSLEECTIRSLPSSERQVSS